MWAVFLLAVMSFFIVGIGVAYITHKTILKMKENERKFEEENKNE